jgi:EAL domain-containing protein (putative c-di-GMP-specific phosphodiesterase class I)/FixJ family two-component response regulator
MNRRTERYAYVLDDEPEVGTLVCHFLIGSGFFPQHFSEPIPFLVRIKAAAPELIVLDLTLGQTDAVEIIRQLEVLKYRGTLLLISGRYESSLAKVNDIGKSHGLAMLPPLQKPFGASEFMHRLNAAPEVSESLAEKRNGRTDLTPMDLGEALRNRWLELWYQPKIDLKSLKVCGAEALLRARHPRRGIMSPARFLPPPGDPQYTPLTNFVIQQALADWSYFAERDVLLKLAVNVPVSAMRVSAFIPSMRQSLPNDPRFPGLIIEVTEDEAIRDPQWMQEIVTQLKLYNISLSIDDFGSGYASLSRLRDLPCTEVKLDHTFVSNCSSDKGKQLLCGAAIDLAHGFGATVCAEGVESVQDLRTLTRLRCDAAQGFLFAKPMNCKDFLENLCARVSGANGRACSHADAPLLASSG